MTIAHQKLANNFTIIANACINDPRLGFEALAIFTHLRSKPGNWVVRPNEIAARFKAGRDRVRKALNQLVECGYIGKAQTRDPATGRLGAIEYVVRVLPEAAPGEPAEVEIAAPPIAPPSPEAPSPENPSTVIRSLLSTDLLPSTDSTKKKERTLASAQARSVLIDLDEGEGQGEGRQSFAMGEPVKHHGQPDRPTDADIDQIFDEQFWPAYPKRRGEQNEAKARRRFRKIVRAGADVDKIIIAAAKLDEHWAPTLERKPSEGKFIPMASTWLIERRWEGAAPVDAAEPETIFDLANHFRNRVAMQGAPR